MSLLSGIFKSGALMDQIRCDEQSYLIWKWRPSGKGTGIDLRENAIRWGSSLRVKEGEVAVFFYKQNDQVIQEYIEGPFDQQIETKNFPILADVVGLLYDKKTPFQAEIYFINLARIIQIDFAVPYFDVFDPRFLDFGVPTAVRGKITFNIKNYKEFIKLHRLAHFDLDMFKSQIKDYVSKSVKDVVTNIPAQTNIPLVQIERSISTINKLVEDSIRSRLERDFGVYVSSVDINCIDIDKTSEGYNRLQVVTRDVSAAKIKAETTDYIENLRIKREEGQYAMHKQTQNSNIDPFRVEKQAEVGIAGANALGNMGASGSGNVDLGGGNSGFNPAAMMAGMAVGGAVGQNIAGAMNGMLYNNNAQSNVTPPPIPVVGYNVVIDGKSTGPYDINTLEKMAQSGQINPKTLVWKPGMEKWNSVAEVNELSSVISFIPPSFE